MLVLSRKVGEKVFIGNDIIISVLETGKSEVKLGFDAPKEIKIFREEVLIAQLPDDPGSSTSLTGET